MNQYKLEKGMSEVEHSMGVKYINIYHTTTNQKIVSIFSDQMIRFTDKTEHWFSLSELKMIQDIANNFQVIYNAINEEN